MQRLLKELRTQLRYQIILPFLLLTFSVAFAGGVIVFNLLGDSLRERFDRQLADVTRGVSDAIVKQEQANLNFLYSVAFAQRNDAVNAPAIADALAAEELDQAGLSRALKVFYDEALITRQDVNLDRLIVFDANGQTVVDFERPETPPFSNAISHSSIDLSGTSFVQQILRAELDPIGDKYAGLIRFTDTDTTYFATVAPIRQGTEIVGGVIAAIRMDNLATSLVRDVGSRGLRLAGVVVYDAAGHVISTSFEPGTVPPMSVALLSEFEATENPFNEPLLATQMIGDQDVKFAYIPMLVRGVNVGILAASLPTDLMFDPLNSIFWPIVGLIVTIAIVVLFAGVLIAKRITRPLEELAHTSMDVASGKLDRRARVRVENEIGQLAVSFNQMTEYLIRLYDQVQVEANQRAAIVESITDGIVVVDDQGNVKLVNRATRRLMGLSEDAPMPKRLSDIPMQKLLEGVPGFGGQRAQDLYTLGEYIVRASIAPVVGSDRNRSGYVCVLQDMTAEVAVDRAKTNFIGTISHELRTPLTVITGNADLLLRGLAGRLEDEQVSFVETIRQHGNNMAGLLQNVITVANLDAGIISTELTPLDLARPVDEANWRVQSQIKAKGLTLNVQIPKDLRPVLADFDHVRQVVHQLLDNARRYTSEGSITVRALDQGDHVRVEVEDTGRGIPPDMYEQIFQRFIRGDGTSEGINSSERGIGLGLAISKHLVERQGGTIGVASVLGKGSTFYFTLRYANDTTTPEKTSQLVAAD
ncbi:MAG: ATP-binding protein [Oscillochloridaceae bacterium umkhey_bin13]